MEESVSMETIKICPSCRKPLPPDMPLGLCPECLLKSGLPSGTEASVTAGFVPPTVAEMAGLFPQFEILAFVGKGGMGAVYKVRQPILDRLIALKILPPVVAGDAGFAERFNREARALARLNHPNIVAVYDFGKAGDLPYLTMEFVDGSNLREVERAGTLTPPQAMAIVPQICEALQYAHNEGVVHRDIKPENILIDKKGRVKIADFGIAKIVGVPAGQASLTGAQDVMGTPHYMAPEQVERPQTVDHRADIYSLGVVFYEMLTGELPLGKFATPSQKVQVDVRLDEVVLRTLEKEPARRYQQASQVKTDVETISSSPSSRPPPAPPIPPLASPLTQTGPPPSDKIIFPAFILAFFFGIFGAHRFYVGKTGTAIVQLFTLGGLGIWSTIDWIMLVCKVFTDGQGRRMTHWFHPDPNAPVVSPPPMAAPKTPGEPNAMIVAPAIALMVAGIWNICHGLLAIGFVNSNSEFFDSILPFHATSIMGFNALFFKITPALFILFGAIQMLEIRNYAWAVAAAGLAIFSCSLFAFVAGIWALVVLMLGDVRQTFTKRAQPVSAPTKWYWIFGGVCAVSLLWFILAMAMRSAPSNHSENFGPNLASLSNLSKLSELSKLSQLSELANIGQPLASTDRSSSGLTPVAAVTNSLSSSTTTNMGSQVIEVGSQLDFGRGIAVDPVGELTLDVDRGEVNVTGSDQSAVFFRVKRKVTRADDAEAVQILKDEDVVLKQNGDSIAVTAHTPPGLNPTSFWSWFSKPELEASYEIGVPRGFSVRLKTAGGNVHVTGIHGYAEVKTLGGSLVLHDIDGKVTGKTLGGNINATACKSDLSIHTMGGSIRVERFTGPAVEAGTAGGSINVDFAASPMGDCTLETSGGSIHASLPPSAAITVDAHTMGGSVRTDLPVQIEGRRHDSSLKGTINGGGPLLKLATMGGSIDVVKR